MTEHQDDIPGPEDTTEEVISPAPSPRSFADPLIGTKIGSCTLKRIIGSGGMGTVYEAVQEKPRRRVALKMMKRGITSRSATRRFEFESQTLARLQHPGVAQIYEAGTHDDGSGGVPYFVMEYVASAKPITQYADDKKLGTKDRLALFSKVCDAVQHGHLKGIVHRDLKPGNILVDSNGQPKVIDFGVARSTDSDMAVTTLQTDVGQLIGTLQYMSPEQCEADPSDIDGRSDVYALGVVLYELLIGKPPYNLQRMAIHEAVRIVREEEPTKLSTIDRHLRGDIETIAMKALEKDRDRRYQSATALEEDIQHYLIDEPISARPPGAIDYLRRFTRKHRAAAVAIASVFVVLVLSVVVSLGFYVKVKIANLELDAQRKEALRQAYFTNIHAASAAIDYNELRVAHQHLADAQDTAEELNWDETPFEWKYLNAKSDDSLALIRHDRRVSSVAFSPDGLRIISGSSDGTVHSWDAVTGEELFVLEGHEDTVQSVAFSPDGSLIISGSSDGTVRIWDAETEEELFVLGGHEEWVMSVAFSPDGKLIISGGLSEKVRIWDTETGEELFVLEGHGSHVYGVAFSPDGSRIISGSENGTVYFWDSITGEKLAVLKSHEGSLTSVAISPDGTRIISGSFEATVRIWDAETEEELAVLKGHEDTVWSVAFSPDGSRIVSGSNDNTVRIWDVATGEELSILNGHKRPVRGGVAFSPDGLRIISGSSDGTVRIWDATISEKLSILNGDERVASVAFSPDGKRIISGSLDKKVRIWDAETGEELSTLYVDATAGFIFNTSVAFSPDGLQIISHTITSVLDGAQPLIHTACIWDAATGEELTLINETVMSSRMEEFESNLVAYSPDGTRIILGGKNIIRIVDVATDETIVNLRGHVGLVRSVAFSPDGLRIISGSYDGTVRIWETRSRSEVAIDRRKALFRYEQLLPLVTSWMQKSQGDSELMLALLEQEINKRSTEEASILRNLVLRELSFNSAIKSFSKSVDGLWNDASGLNSIAWNVAVSDDVEFFNTVADVVLRTAQRACELSGYRDSMILDTLARVHFERGEIEDAIRWQKKAVEYATEPYREQFSETLVLYARPTLRDQ